MRQQRMQLAFLRSRGGSFNALITSAPADGTTDTFAWRFCTVSFTVTRRPFQSLAVSLAMSSPIFFGDRPRGPICIECPCTRSVPCACNGRFSQTRWSKPRSLSHTCATRGVPSQELARLRQAWVAPRCTWLRLRRRLPSAPETTPRQPRLHWQAYKHTYTPFTRHKYPTEACSCLQ